jgi:hypothetical protein
VYEGFLYFVDEGFLYFVNEGFLYIKILHLQNIKILHLQNIKSFIYNYKGVFLSYVRDVPSMFWRIKWYGTLCANKQNSVQGVPGFEVVQKESRWRNRLSFFLT